MCVCVCKNYTLPIYTFHRCYHKFKLEGTLHIHRQIFTPVYTYTHCPTYPFPLICSHIHAHKDTYMYACIYLCIKPWNDSHKHCFHTSGNNSEQVTVKANHDQTFFSLLFLFLFLCDLLFLRFDVGQSLTKSFLLFWVDD